MAKKRVKLSKRQSVRKFKKGDKVNVKNLRPLPTRGGYRL